MYGIPTKLFTASTPMFSDTNIMFGIGSGKNTFYTVKDGNWTDLTIWECTNGLTGASPTGVDDVYIRHTITMDGVLVDSGWVYVNNLYVSGYLLFATNANAGGNNANFQVNGNLQCSQNGTLDASTTIMYTRIYLAGNNNIISNANFLFNTYTVLYYNRSGDQSILDLNYVNFGVSGSGTKTPINDLNVGGVLYISGNLALGSYNLTVSGYTACGNNSSITKLGAGNILFVGGFGTGNAQTINFSGNPTVELRGGITNGGYLNMVSTGTGLWRFTTNNQSIGNSVAANLTDSNFTFTGNLSIENITVTVMAGLCLNGTINGTTSTSKLINQGPVYFLTSTSLASMSTGVSDFSTYVNTIVLPQYYTGSSPANISAFYHVFIAGTKTLASNTTFAGNLTIGYNPIYGYVYGSTLDCLSYNLSIGGSTTLGRLNFEGCMSTLLKSGSGSVVFVGNISTGNGNNYSTPSIDFSGGNPTVECRGGISGNNPSATTFKSGTGTWNFTTNNQSIAPNGNSYGFCYSFDGPVLINNISLTVTNPGASAAYINLNNTINGVTSTSKLINQGSVWFNTTTSLNSMSTGSFDYATTANVISFSGNYTYTIPSSFATISSLSISGTGIKTLSSNVVLSGNLLLYPSANLELSTYNLTVSGTTILNRYSTSFTKSGAGSLLFVGNIYGSQYGNFGIDFSGGNPTVECRGGINLKDTSAATINFGTGQWSFTTNSQNINSCSTNTFTVNCPILVSGAITLTLGDLNTSGVLLFNNSINGNNTSSTLDNRITGSTTYNNTTQPMLTGVLQTNAALNTWIYGGAAQNIKGGSYRNLTLNGSGVKTLQGNVSVVNTYTLTAPATVATNGFALTNP